MMKLNNVIKRIIKMNNLIEYLEKNIELLDENLTANIQKELNETNNLDDMLNYLKENFMFNEEKIKCLSHKSGWISNEYRFTTTIDKVLNISISLYDIAGAYDDVFYLHIYKKYSTLLNFKEHKEDIKLCSKNNKVVSELYFYLDNLRKNKK